MSTMSDWVETVCRELDLRLADPAATTSLVLDLTADVAHGVARPAAPVTAFLLGVAAGRADDPDVAATGHAARLRELAAGWESPVEH